MISSHRNIRGIITISIVAGLILFTELCQAADIGEVDWTSGYIEATGIGVAPEGTSLRKARYGILRSAQIDAQRNLLETIKGVQIDSETTIRDAILEKDLATTRVKGVLKGAFVVNRKATMEDGEPVGYVTMRVCLSRRSAQCSNRMTMMDSLHIDQYVEKKRDVIAKNLENMVYQPKPEPTISNRPQFVTASSTPSETMAQPEPIRNSADSSYPTQPPSQVEARRESTPEPSHYQHDANQPITGLIVDLRDQNYKHQVMPVILARTQNNKLVPIYSVLIIEPKILQKFEPVWPVKNLSQALNLKHLGSNPILFSAKNVTSKQEVILSKSDGEEISLTTRQGNNYLKKARVGFIIR